MRIKLISIWVLFNLIVFIIINTYQPTRFFSSDVDGFYSQMYNYHFGDVLSGIHGIRKIIVYPFIFFEDRGFPLIFQPLLMIVYILPIFYININPRLKIASVAVFYLVFFVSYRTVLVNISTYIFFCLTFYNISRKMTLYALVLSVLSSGTLLLSLFFIFINRKKLFKNIAFINKLIILALVCLLMYGPVLHKLLFFTDSSEFSGAGNVSFDKALSIDLGIVLTNIFQRGVLYISYINGDSIRFYLLIMNLFILVSLCVTSKYQANFIILTLIYSFMMLFEGLGAHSFTLISIVYFSSFWFFSLLHVKTNSTKQSYS